MHLSPADLRAVDKLRPVFASDGRIAQGTERGLKRYLNACRYHTYLRDELEGTIGGRLVAMRESRSVVWERPVAGVDFNLLQPGALHPFVSARVDVRRALVLQALILWAGYSSTANRVKLSTLLERVSHEARSLGVDFQASREDNVTLDFVLRSLQEDGYLGIVDIHEDEAMNQNAVAHSNQMIVWHRERLNSSSPSILGLYRDQQSDQADAAAESEGPSTARAMRWMLFHPSLRRSEDPEAFAALTTEPTASVIRASLESKFQRGYTVILDVVRPYSTRESAYATPFGDLSGHRVRPALAFLGGVRSWIQQGRVAAPADGHLTIAPEVGCELLSETIRALGHHWSKTDSEGSILTIWWHTCMLLRRWGLASVAVDLTLTLNPHAALFRIEQLEA